MEVEVEWNTGLPVRNSFVNFLMNSNLYVNGEEVKVSRDKCEMESKFNLCNTLTMILLIKRI